jgi:hypothetical protein
MRAKGCVVWYIDEVQQVPDEDEDEDEKNGDKNDSKESGEKDHQGYDPMNPIVQRMMAMDAKTAEEKQYGACKQVWGYV